MALETIEIETAPQPNAAVIWLHGLGADGHDFEPVVPEIVRRGERAWRFIFPNAPIRPVTINGGMACAPGTTSWDWIEARARMWTAFAAPTPRCVS